MKKKDISPHKILKSAITAYMEWYKKVYSRRIKRQFVLDEISNYLASHNMEKSLTTIRHQINGQRKIQPAIAEIYGKWLMDQMKNSPDIVCESDIEQFLEGCDVSRPGEIIHMYVKTKDSKYILYNEYVQTNVPKLDLTYAQFLGRHEEIEYIRQWADRRQSAMAALCGFGGNGKTTLQKKIGHLFIHGPKCPLKYPFEGAVWISDVDDYPLTYIKMLGIICQTMKLDIDPERMKLNYVEKKIHEALQNKRMLLLLDNYETIHPAQKSQILLFLMNMNSDSQVLISSRQDLNASDALHEIHQHGFPHDNVSYQLKIIGGLSDEDANHLIHAFCQKEEIVLSEKNIQHLSKLTQNNPKVILSVLGLIQNNTDFDHFVANFSADARFEDVFHAVIHQTFFNHQNCKNIFMAKGLFCCTVKDSDLEIVADIHGSEFQHIVKELHSLFLLEKDLQRNRRIKAHPLSQQYAIRLLKENSEFAQKAETRLYNHYIPSVLEYIQQTNFEDMQINNNTLNDDISNVVERLLFDVNYQTVYLKKALALLGKRHGFGYYLTLIGHWSRAQNIAETVLQTVRTINDIDNHFKMTILGESILQLVKINCYQGSPEKSQRFIGIAEEENYAINNKWLAARINFCQGQVRREFGQFNAAKDYYGKSIELLEKMQTNLQIQEDLSDALWHLSGVIVESSNTIIKEAIDHNGILSKELNEANQYLNKSQTLIKNVPFNHGLIAAIYAYKGIIFRIQGDLEQARHFLAHPKCKFTCIRSVARVKLERALIEHLDNNFGIAETLKAEGMELLSQVNLSGNKAPTWWNCYRILKELEDDQ